MAEGTSRSQREDHWVSFQLSPQSPHAPPWFPGPETRTCPARASGKRRHPARAACGAVTSARRRPQICPARLVARPRRSPGSPGRPKLCAAPSGAWLRPRRAMRRTSDRLSEPTTLLAPCLSDARFAQFAPPLPAPPTPSTKPRVTLGARPAPSRPALVTPCNITSFRRSPRPISPRTTSGVFRSSLRPFLLGEGRTVNSRKVSPSAILELDFVFGRELSGADCPPRAWDREEKLSDCFCCCYFKPQPIFALGVDKATEQPKFTLLEFIT